MKRSEEKPEIPFAEPWLDMTCEPRKVKMGLLIELKREVHRAHPLYKLDATVIGQRQDNDDILIELEDGLMAVVHLTWSGKKEYGPWPATQVYSSRENFIENRLLPDIADFND